MFKLALKFLIAIPVVIFAIAIGADKFKITDASDQSAKTNSTPNDTSTSINQEMNVVEVMSNDPTLSTLMNVLKTADLVSTLEGKGPMTIFAPTNDAFQNLPPGTFDSLVRPENKARLKDVLTYHVIPEKIVSKDLKTGTLKALDGKDLDVVVDGSTIMINNAKVLKSDMEGSNGVVYVIDTVLIP